MRPKRLCALLLALSLVLGLGLPAAAPLGLATVAGAIPARGEEDRYYGKQLAAPKALGAESRAFYDALVAMYADGASGSALLEGRDQPVALSAAQVQAYLNGQSNLGHALTNARDAFYMDYPDLFYVNFNNFALRAAKDEAGAAGIYITPGTRGTGYLLDGITGDMVPELVRHYDDSLAELVKAAQGAVRQSWESSDAAARVRAVHDKLTQMLTYRLDNECREENRKYIRTAYGIYTGEGVCEAYSRAFKSAMDALGIPCVLVEGAFRHSAERIEAHMWACVQVEGKWYGVDVTMDDPDNPIVDAYGDTREGAVAYNDYLLAGDVAMSAQHAASKTMSAASYEFDCPTLTQNDYAEVTMHNAGGLKVRLDRDGSDLAHEGGDGSGTFYVSYNGMSYSKAAEQGYYILARFMSVNTDADVGHEHFEGDGEWSQNEDWAYLCPQLYPTLEKLETDTETPLPMPHVRYVQFAVTDRAPADPRTATSIYDATTYQGDPALLLAKTDVLENEGGTYEAPPYIKQAWPTQQSTMLIGHAPYDIRVQLDEKLVLEPGAELGYDLKTYAFVNGKREDYDSAQQNCTVGPLHLSADGTEITFTFQPSEMWAHDTIFYEFSFTGVVGETSKKKPNSLVYLASHPCSAYAYQSQGFDWNLYGKPQLMDDFANSEIKTDGWEIKDGNSTKDLPTAELEKLKHRMTLVVSDTTPDQTAAMKSMAQQKAGSEPLWTETYSINLTVCKSQIVKTGQAVRVMLGFPEGYGPDMAGVTFKAYHYKVNDRGEFVGVEEIPCIVTPQGLLVLCDSFSPFSICALPASETGSAAERSKELVVSTSCGGGTVEIAGADELETGSGVYTLTPGKRCTVTVTPPENQQISAMTLAGEPVDVTNSRDGITLELAYEQLQGLMTGILDVQFAPASWISHNTGELALAPTLPDVTVTLPEKAGVAAGARLTIEAAVTTAAAARAADADYVYTYKWFKNGQELAGHTERTFTVNAAAAQDAGAYQVEVALSSAATGLTQSKTARSGDCIVTVTQAAPPAPADPAPEEEPAPTAAPQPTATRRPGGGVAASTPKPSPTTAAAAATVPTAAPTATPTAASTPAPTTAPSPAPAAQENGGISLPLVLGVFGGILAAGGLAGVLVYCRRKTRQERRSAGKGGGDRWSV